MTQHSSEHSGNAAILAQALAALATLLGQDAWRESAARGLSATQSRALGLLAGYGPTRPGLLAKQLGVSAPTLSDALAALEAKGLLRREPDPSDSRAVQAAATEAGVELAASLQGWPSYLASALEALPAEDQAGLRRGLLRLLATLESGGRLPPLRACPGCVHLRPGAHPGSERPQHCARFDSALGPANLRLDCPEFSPASPEQARRGLAAWLDH